MKRDDTTWQAGWHFENTYEKLPNLFFSFIKLSPVRAPQMVKLNEDLAKALGLDVNDLKSEAGLAILAGNQVPDGTMPLAQAYAGHQFGYFTKLGDGRALLIGEHITPLGERLDIQLKGSGRTPYSRHGDGRATLGPMLREYLISEAMYGLGIPTTRSLAVVTTGETVMREKAEPGAILTRVAKSHLRVGTFQYAAEYGDQEALQRLADYALERHFQVPDRMENKYHYLLQEVVKRQAQTLAKWQLVGFIHGVMNTDNMTISGESIDYGPCAFMDAYDLNTVFSSIDKKGRYAFGNQPRIGAWNLARLAEALLPLLDPDEDEAVKLAEATISQFGTLYQEEWLKGMGAKLGISHLQPEDQTLIETLLKIMAAHKADYTNTFVALTTGELGEEAFYKSQDFLEWYALWKERIKEENRSLEETQAYMKQHNPYVIPRNHLVEEALKEAVEAGNYSKMDALVHILADPYAYSEEQRPYTDLPQPTACPYRTFCGT